MWERDAAGNDGHPWVRNRSGWERGEEDEPPAPATKPIPLLPNKQNQTDFEVKHYVKKVHVSKLFLHIEQTDLFALILTPIPMWPPFNVLQTVLYGGKGCYREGLIPEDGNELPTIVFEGGEKPSAHFGHMPKREQTASCVLLPFTTVSSVRYAAFPLSCGINCARCTSYPSPCSHRTRFRAVHDPRSPMKMNGFHRTYQRPDWRSR